jgi:RNA polymerase sigma-70 factor (ECF subfamily)
LDIVQETLFRGYKNVDQFRGDTDAELAAWLRRILLNYLAEVLRKLGTATHQGEQERSLEMSGDRSSPGLEDWLASGHSSPSERAMRHEELLCLARALAQLPENQRTVLELKHLQGWSVEAIAQQMGLSKSAIGGLLRRGMRKLRDLMEGRDS